MTVSTESDVYYDPYDVDINADPYPVFRRLRDEAPLYYNEHYDFCALSRFDDVERGASSTATRSARRAATMLEIDQGGHRAAARASSSSRTRRCTRSTAACCRASSRRSGWTRSSPRSASTARECLDPLVGADGFDFVADLGAQMPMRVIGMLLGIPEADQEAIRDRADARLRTRAGQADWTCRGRLRATASCFADYIDWRAEHPSDDLMTELLNAEFEDETGTVRRLSRDEVLIYVNVLAGGGQRDHQPADRLDRQGARPSIPTSAASWSRTGR